MLTTSASRRRRLELTPLFLCLLHRSHGAFKLHFYTRCAYCSLSPERQDPPLLFNVEQDPFEAYPLDVQAYAAVVANLTALFEEYAASIATPPASEIDKFNLEAAPCCDPFPADRPCHCSDLSETAGHVQSTGHAGHADTEAYTRQALREALPQMSPLKRHMFSRVLGDVPPEGATVHK